MHGLVVLVLFLIVWGSWYRKLIAAFAPAVSLRLRLVTGLIPLAAFSAFAGLFLRYADASALKDDFWCLAFPVIGALCLRLTVLLLDGLQLQLPADITGRNNPASLPAFAGALLGVAALNVGSNLGRGDEAYTTLFPLALTSALWVAFAVLLAACTPLLSATVTDRRITASVQLGAVWLTSGLILARAAAGDWVSFSATTLDLLGAMPALAVLLTSARYIGRLAPLLTVCIILVVSSFWLPQASAWHLP
ncbi:MAG: hypothetical protein JSS11_01305 [Verrucomicrobia bacterium]|nr:hypothetical protein [Verrucomicrobiota bacterium]